MGEFLAEADRVWYDAIITHYKSFHGVSDPLVKEREYIRLYDKLAVYFPLHWACLLNISYHKTFFEKARFDENKLNEHKKVALCHFLALCRSRNKNCMTHWAMVETLAAFGKGISHVTTRSVTSKNYTTTLRYALNMLDEYYSKCVPEIRELLTREPIIA